MKKTKVLIETHGCQMNVADTERAASKLRAAGFEVIEQTTDDEEAADVVILNTCSVRERAERKVYTRVGEIRHAAAEARRSQPLIAVTGCVAQLQGEAIFAQAAGVRIVAGTRATDRLPQLIERALHGEQSVLDLDERAAGEDWDVPAHERRSPYVAFVPIIEGCNKFCTYCIVPYSRGREKSRPATDIIREIENLAHTGVKEVQLIGQNVNSYRPKLADGLERVEGATSFARLLRAVAATQMPRVKFTTSFPRDFHADIVRAIDEHENLCNWVHLPVQSGSDRVLRAMRRGYKRADYMARVESIKKAQRHISLTSDIIVGFPGETDDDFRETLNLVEACEYDGLYIFKYSPRAQTPASILANDVGEALKTARFGELEAAQRKIQRRLYERYIGSEQIVLFTGYSAKSKDDVTGHTTCHKVFNCRGGRELLGTIRRVRVTQAKANSLYGEVVL